ncbi:MAG TPA: TIR domain-containing protein [Candidatus Angelobacter sp.]|nr:TIR domain-containing protein [Candidatus Angelobacter sp.]
MITAPNHVPSQPLKVFLCHASEDKPVIRELYRKLKMDGFSPWLDEVDIPLGQMWQSEIRAAIRTSDAFLVCLSQSSVSKEGYVQAEIASALDIAKEKPEGTIFIVPVRLDNVVKVPDRLSQYQWGDFFKEDGYPKIVHALKLRAEKVGVLVKPPVLMENNVIVSGPTPIEITLPLEHSAEGIFEELKEVQGVFNYLPVAELQRVATRRGLQFQDVRDIASYYPHFHLQPPARVDVGICDDMTCHLRGAMGLRQMFEQRFKGMPKEDLTFRIVSCLGSCDHAPAFAINDRYYDGLSSSEAISVVTQTLQGSPPPSSSYELPLVPSVPSVCDPYGGKRLYSALKRFVQTRQWEDLLAELKAADLRGMGGAGFPVWMKWNRVRASSSGKKYVVCNANNSEPGSIKDRFILTHLPHLVVEGMILAGLCVGAEHGYLYVRHEYQKQQEILRRELDHCRKEQLIGRNVLGSDLSFDVELFVSPGGYICGEESALLEAIEGKRAQPRNRPPLIVDVGLWGNPTQVNNVETLAFATAIAARSEFPGKGADWFNSCGINGSKGLKFVGVSGDVKKPGIYEVPMGIKYQELIFDEKYGGGLRENRELVAFAPSGPSSGYLPASMADLPLDWAALQKAGSMIGSCAIVVCGTGTCMLDMALNAVRFYRNESCGKCTPCRGGSRKLVEVLEQWTRGNYQRDDLRVMEELSHVLRMTSICGLGQILPAPIQSVLWHFKEEVSEHLDHRHCRAGVCFREEKTTSGPAFHLLSKVLLRIDENLIEVPAGTTILDAARRLGIEIPAPCYHQHEVSDAECRVCVVDVGGRAYAAACMLRAEVNPIKKDPNNPDMIVQTNTREVQAGRETLLKLLMADHHAPCLKQRQSGDCELERLAERWGVNKFP